MKDYFDPLLVRARCISLVEDYKLLTGLFLFLEQYFPEHKQQIVKS